MNVEIIVSGDAQRALSQLDVRASELLRQIAQQCGLLVEGRWKELEFPHRYTGTLVRSIATEVRQLGDSVTAAVGSNLAYAPMIEFGRRPGSMPPVEELVPWARAKLGDASLAYPIARAIARRGTQGRGTGQRALEESERDMARVVDGVLGRWVDGHL